MRIKEEKLVVVVLNIITQKKSHGTEGLKKMN